MTGTPWHPDVDELADLAEGGILAAQDEARLRAHVDGCAECARTCDDLAGVSALLGSLPPERMPDDVAARLDALFVPAAPVALIPRQASAPQDELAPRRRRTYVVLGAAAACAALLGVLLGTGVLDDTSSSSRASEGVPAPVSTAPPTQAAAAAPASPVAPGAAEAVPTSVVVTAANLPDVTHALLAAAHGTAPSCVTDALGVSPTSVRAAERATYDGQPAWLVVVGTENARTVHAVVVPASCAGAVLLETDVTLA